MLKMQFIMLVVAHFVLLVMQNICSTNCLPFTRRQKVQSELEDLKKDLNNIAEKTEEVLASPQQSSSSPMLRSELDVTLRKMDQVYGLSSVYLDKCVYVTLLPCP